MLKKHHTYTLIGTSIIFTILLNGCAAGNRPTPTNTSSQIDPAQTTQTTEESTQAKNEISSTSEVRSFDAEFNEYINHSLGISIKFPKKVLVDMMYSGTGNYPSVPVRIVENGEVISFSRSYDQGPGNKENLTTRTPYYTSKYPDDPSYPYQVYAAKINNRDELKLFVERAYGKGCIPGGPSTYTDRPGIETYTIENSKNCPSTYPVGDVIVWNPEKHVAVGYQPGWIGYFTKPYFVDPSQKNYYEIQAEFK